MAKKNTEKFGDTQATTALDNHGGIKYHITDKDNAFFNQICKQALEHEHARKAANPLLYTSEDAIEEYIADANDYEKHLLIDRYRKMGYLDTSGVRFYRANYKTDIINDNYDAYLLVESRNIGDYDINEIIRDEEGNIKEVHCTIHQDRFACMSDMYKRDKTSQVIVYGD